MSETDKRGVVNLDLLEAFADMLEVPRWCVWYWQTKTNTKTGRKWKTKVGLVPGSITHVRVNEAVGTTYAVARDAALVGGGVAGVGWRLLDDIGRVWIDIDKCRDLVTGEIAPWARALLDWAPEAYREITPSGTGMRLLGVTTDLEPFSAHMKMAPLLSSDADLVTADWFGGRQEHQPRAGIEIYHACARFVTVTGHEGRGRADVDLTELVAWLMRLALAHGGNNHVSRGRAGAAAVLDPDLTGPIEDIVAALAVMKNEAVAWDIWNNIGMATVNAAGREAGESIFEAFEAFDAWSAKCPEKYDPEETTERWDHWLRVSPADQLGIGTLMRLAREADPAWRRPSRRPEAEFDVVDLPPGSPSGPVTPDGGEKPIIKVRAGELHRLASEAEAAIISSGIPVFQRSMLVRPAITELDAADDGKTHVMALRRLDAAGMLDLFCQTGKWMKFSRQLKKDIPADPPETVAKILLGRLGEWKLPHLRGVIAHPTLRRDGSMLATPGYDKASGYYLAMPSNLIMPPVAEAPTRGECVAALASLEELLTEFPFIKDGGASHSVALSLLMTAVLRSAMDVAPIHAATAPRRGTGKSFLYDIAAAIVHGSQCPVIYAGKSEEELEKKLNGMLLAGVSLFSIDNLNIPLEGDLICQIATQTLLDLRRLGRSDIYRTPNSAFVGVTGNNLTVVEDVARRVVMASMDAEVERPEKRVFKGNPFRRALKERGRYLAAVLTIVRGFMASGDKAGVSPLGSFDDYSRFVREPLVWLGQTDPADTMEKLHAADPAMAVLRGVMAAWEAAIGLGTGKTAAEAIDLTQNPSREFEDIPSRESDAARKAREARDKARVTARVALGEAIAAVGKSGARISSRELGYWLRHNAGAIVDGRRFTGKTNQRNMMEWSLTPLL